MHIDNFILGAYETNSYLLRKSRDDKDCLLIDTGLEADELASFLADNSLNLVAVVLTHGHADHMGGLVDLREDYPQLKVYIHELDAPMLHEPEKNLSIITGRSLKTDPADILLSDGEIIKEIGIELLVLHTPGHTPGGICLYCKEDNVLFSGDTLFADSVGRTDFPGGDMPQLINGIREKLITLPDETKVYPGHGPATTLAREKAYNQYLQ